jgi:fibrillarin-like rRNA methylase
VAGGVVALGELARLINPAKTVLFLGAGASVTKNGVSRIPGMFSHGAFRVTYCHTPFSTILKAQ